ncbi:MAG: hypothetical protein K8E66_05460 [Phycisphaerales bacterium]|nr:hypothetical protein [Phycisphaerales bacterium]
MNIQTIRLIRPGWIGVLVAMAVFPLVVRGQSPSLEGVGEGGGPVNTMCPVTTDEEVDPRFTVEYEGVTVGLCCRKCRTKFEQDPSAYVANLPVSFSQAGMAQDHREEPPDGHEHAASDEHAQDASGDEGDVPRADAEVQHQDETPDHADGGDGHDHAHSHDSASRSRIAVWIGKFHPPATHLPIGLLIGAVVAESGLIATGRVMFRHATTFCLVLAGLGAIAASLLGWFNGGLVLWDEDWVQATHRWLGTATAVMTLVAAIFALRAACAAQERRGALRFVLLTAAGLVGATGFFGGALVFGLGHYAW